MPGLQGRAILEGLAKAMKAAGVAALAAGILAGSTVQAEAFTLPFGKNGATAVPASSLEMKVCKHAFAPPDDPRMRC